MDDARVGVFICDCGSNIAGFLDVPALTEYVQTLPNVVFCQENMYTCSDAGRMQILNGIREHNLDRVVVAACTPRTHEPLFRSTCEQAGLNPYLFEFVNIRDQCSWVHMEQRERGTQKAKDLLRMGVARATLLEPKEGVTVGVLPSALVIGAGVAGLTAAYNLADRGFAVKLVEREAEMGGLLRHVHTLYPTGEDAQPFLQKKIDAVKSHRNIEIFTSTQVRDVRGFVGNYQATIGSSSSGANGNETVLDVGAIIVATGAQEREAPASLSHDKKRIVTQQELEGLLAEGMISAESGPQSVVMIQCVRTAGDGSAAFDRPYCSRICCMTAVKNAMLIRDANPNARVYVLYRDMLTLGTTYEDLYREARGRGVVFIQYDPEAPPTVEDGHVVVSDARLGRPIALPADLVALSVPLEGRPGADELAQTLKVPLDEHGFFLEAHVKLRPLDFSTDGIYLCGSAHWPSDVGESVSQANGAAARASILLGKGEVEVEPITSMVDSELCIGCGLCELMCPYSAMTLRDNGEGRKAENIPASCKGCGVCGAGCPAGAITMQHFTNEQIMAQVNALLTV